MTPRRRTARWAPYVVAVARPSSPCLAHAGRGEYVRPTGTPTSFAALPCCPQLDPTTLPRRAMGTEYQLKFAAPDRAALMRTLGALPLVRHSDGLHEVVFSGAPSGMPDATFQLTPDGAYFCDFGGSGREMLGRVIAAVLGHAPSIHIEEL